MEIHRFTNALINSSSPYLLQHAHNPVNWYPWGSEAFEKARAENKLVLISIGYAACHWCHVMAHESFEQENIAQLMNEKYVCIKIDREERPDVDQVYMEAVQLITGSGGWPLNCFALPNGRPVYGGTYFKPEQWIQVLEDLNHTFKASPDKVLAAANDIQQGVAKQNLILIKKSIPLFSKALLDEAILRWKPYFDANWGGNIRAPKFPMPAGLELLLDYVHQTPTSYVTEHLQLTLDKMASGGIYDQIIGGFSRYSVDNKWKVPHFEKMLYDNGQLVSLYAKAFKLFNKTRYKTVVEQTLAFIQTEMLTTEGGFYSSFDADSEGVEGKFYVWDKIEIEQILGDEAPWYCSYFNVSDAGNWEGKNILWVTEPDWLKQNLGWSEQYQLQKIHEAHQKLAKQRAKRIYPGLDDKILCSWNAMMGIAFIDAFDAFQNSEYLNVAISNACFLQKNVLKADGDLFRNYKNGVSSINAFLDDYAYLIKFYIRLYQATFDLKWLMDAEKLMNDVNAHFYNPESGMFYYTHNAYHELVVRKKEIADNVIPSSNSLMAHNLYDLGSLLSNAEWLEMARQMLANVLVDMEQNIPYYGNWGQLHLKMCTARYEVVFMGENALQLRNEFVSKHHANVLIAGATKDMAFKIPLLQNRWIANENLIYVCEGQRCNLPVKTVLEALELLRIKKPV
jgi:uncharacterized protein YyaL (SSP411 family)